MIESAFFVVALGALIAGFLQGLSGFAFSLVSTAVWAWAIDPQLSALLATFGALCGQVVAAFTVRHKRDWRRLAPFLLGGVAGIPLGAYVLDGLDPQLFKLVLGGLLVTWCPAMLLSNMLPRLPEGSRRFDGGVGLAGGLLAGLGGFAGVLPTLWCTLQGLQKDAQRALIQNFNLAMLAVAMGVHLAQGRMQWQQWPSFAMVAIAVALSSAVGTRLHLRFSELAFRRMVLGLLSLSGLAMLVSALRHLL